MSVVNECSKGKNIKKQFNRVEEKEEKILKEAVMENNRPETEDDHFLKSFFAYNTHTHTFLLYSNFAPQFLLVAIISEGNDKSEITKYN